MSNYVKLSDDNLLAEYVELDRFKKVLEQRVAVGPDTLAMLIKDGQIAEASAGAHFAIGGLWRTIKDAVAGKHAIRLLIADLKPFQVSRTETAVTKDHVPVACEFTVELQVNPEKPANVLGFMKEHTAVTKDSVLNRLAPHLDERVLSAAVKRVEALELRGNTGLQDKIQADAMKEVERIAGDTGFIARVVSVGWAFNDEEKAQVLKRQQEREQEILEREFKILNRSVEREGESTIVRLETDLKIEKSKVNTEDDLKRLILNNELNFVDAREAGVRQQQLKALEGELHLNRVQRLDGLKAQLEGEHHAIEMVRTGGVKRGATQDIETQDRHHDIELDKLGGARRGVARDIEKDDRRHDIDLGKIAEDRRVVSRETELKDRDHDVDLTRKGGDRRDVEMAIGQREKLHDLEVTRIQAEMRAVQRSIEDLDRRQTLNLDLLTEEQKLAIAAKAHELQTRTLRDMQSIELDAEDKRLGMRVRGDDAAHARAMEAARQADAIAVEKLRLMKEASAEQIMAINAGLSPQVANVLIEQAKAKAAEGADRIAIMREMIQQAQDGRVASEAQARHMFDQGMQGAIGVAAGAGAGAAGRAEPANPNPALGTTECPGCHRVIPVTDRHCRFCGRAMRQ